MDRTARPGRPAGRATSATPRPRAPRPASGRTTTARPSAARTTSPRPGPAARRPAEASRGRTPQPVEPTSSKAWVRGAVLATIVVMLLVTLVPTARSVIRQRSQIAQLHSTIAAQEADVAAQQAELARWQDPAYVEQQARERLKFVKPGEKSYSVIDPADAAPSLPSGASVAAPSSSGTLPWYGALWKSVQLADQPTAGMEPVAP
ncbi:FtsB family cell division protein [Lapillicoccus jejuensis]|uniref:Cell division protein FtsB n=1 Tax=Lapillicoccus jejuensis TaxID=402171 RepID=A0A542E1K5_9MICO|nr:septum formation initiator family protein [Lapillicoccus jejuensis]TQJ09205.1 cell division protein FtsB [Lapillicoccus jejuensis]